MNPARFSEIETVTHYHRATEDSTGDAMVLNIDLNGLEYLLHLHVDARIDQQRLTITDEAFRCAPETTEDCSVVAISGLLSSMSGIDPGHPEIEKTATEIAFHCDALRDHNASVWDTTGDVRKLAV